MDARSVMFNSSTLLFDLSNHSAYNLYGLLAKRSLVSITASRICLRRDSRVSSRTGLGTTCSRARPIIHRSRLGNFSPSSLLAINALKVGFYYVVIAWILLGTAIHVCKPAFTLWAGHTTRSGFQAAQETQFGYQKRGPDMVKTEVGTICPAKLLRLLLDLEFRPHRRSPQNHTEQS
ncbi:hypothetical protein IQ07DRAFT_305164 [Pyrenochaeta sp. DS3sAY3a]|nr:hypothetical protein IQ07DRAFT_305164 [Pyrenochaeta sp. DS3sAY3a]